MIGITGRIGAVVMLLGSILCCLAATLGIRAELSGTHAQAYPVPRWTDGTLFLSATAVMREVEQSAEVKAYFPALAEAAAQPWPPWHSCKPWKPGPAVRPSTAWSCGCARAAMCRPPRAI